MSNQQLEMNQLEDYSEVLNIPSKPGPALLGRTPAVGSVRREQGVPVLRDELKDY